MCKEDWRLSRKATVRMEGVLAQPGTNETKVMNANPNRYSLSLAIVTSGVDLRDQDMLVYVPGPGGAKLPLVMLTGDHPSANFSLLDIGQLVTEELWAVGRSVDDPPTLLITQTELLEKLENA